MRLRLEPDSTFGCHNFAGQLTDYYDEGTYKFKNDTIYLNYNSGKIDPNDDAENIKEVYDLKETPNFNAFRTTDRFLWRNKKLFCISSQGKIIKKEKAYSANRKWLIWGYKYLKFKNYYLVKRQDLDY
jgi:hypothetical protein